MNTKIYDLIIIGSGPAGLTASIYASRYKVKHIVIGREPGGQMNEAHQIENWPGTISIAGLDLGRNMREHAQKLGVKIIMDSISNISRSEDSFVLATHADQYRAKFIVLALGVEYRKLMIPGEEELKGHGVSYCPTCDAPFFQDKVVAVIGGGNSAASAVELVARYAHKVFMIYRGEKLRADPFYEENFSKNDKIEIIYKTNVKEIIGEKSVEKVKLDNPHNSQEELEVQGVFVEIGSEPGVELVKQLGVETDGQGFIVVNADQSTNVENVYAAGDATNGSNKLRQIVTASAEGAIAAGSVYKKLQVG